MFIKICANTNIQDAALAEELGADALGFVFASSKRRVSVGQVSEIVDHLLGDSEKIGVVASSDAHEIEHIVTCAGLTGVQLHTAFDEDLVHALDAEFGGELKIIQTVAYSVDSSDRLDADAQFENSLREVFAEPAVWAVLIDAAKSGVSGGLGVAFDWHHVGNLVQRAAAGLEAHPRIILAGGLNPDNVANAIEALQPWGIDVATGVEAEPGRKDPQRLRSFIANARRAGDKMVK